MSRDSNLSFRGHLFLAFAFIVASTPAFANFFWPPALYYYGFTVWWAVPVGLAVEYIILLPFLRLSGLHLLKIVVLANLASAFIGFIATWPAVYWEKGVGALVKGGTFSVVSIVALIFVVNVTIEYFVSVNWLNVPRRTSNVVGFVVANLASFAVLVMAGFSQLRI